MPWQKRKGIRQHLGNISDRTLRNYESIGLPFSRLPNGTKLYEIEAVDAWLRSYSTDQRKDATVVDELLRELT